MANGNPVERFRQQAPQQRRGEGLSSGVFLLAGLLAVAFGIGVTVAGYLWMAAPAPNPVADAVLSATGRSDPSAPKPELDRGAWTDADLRGCRKLAADAAETARKRKLAAVSADRVGLGGPDAEIVERATYLLCGATTKPLHLCQRYWRDWLLKAIRAHAVDFRKVSETAYWTKVHLAETARREAAERQKGWQTLSDDLDQTTREVSKMHDDIVAAIRSLIRDGIIEPADFGKFLGFGIPREIRAMIGNASPQRDLCG
jgi:hypothetical protein